jgi:outer membrane protein assembly factor BamA
MTYLQAGEVSTIESVDLEARRMKAYLQENGYPFADEFNLPTVVTAGRDVCPDSLYCDSVIFFIDPGTRFRIDTTVITHRYDTLSPGIRVPAVVDELILGRLRYRHGQHYKRTTIDETRRSLYRLGIFEQVAIDTTLVREEDGLLGLRIRYTLRDKNELEFALESSIARRSDEVVTLGGVSGQYSRLNIGRRAIRMTGSGRIQARLLSLEELEWGVDGRVEIPEPNFLPILSLLPLDFDFFNVTAGYSNAVIDQERDAQLRAQRFLLGIELGISLPSYTMLNSIAGRITFQANNYYGIEEFIRVKARSRVEELATTIPNECDTSIVVESVAGVLARNIYRIQVLQGDALDLLPSDDARAAHGQLDETMTIGATLIGDHRNDFFQPSQGYYVELEGDIGATGFFDFKTGGFFRLEFDARKYSKFLGTSVVMANRLHMGGIFQFGNFPLTPIANRFHAGGANSIRGWGPRELLVTTPPSELIDPCSVIVIEDILDESRRLLGGLALFEFSTEWRIKVFETFVVVPFFDGGNAYFRNYSTDSELLNFSTFLKNIVFAGGLELGYVTPAGPLRVGIGFPIIAPDGQSKSPTWHFSIGHAF